MYYSLSLYHICTILVHFIIYVLFSFTLSYNVLFSFTLSYNVLFSFTLSYMYYSRSLCHICIILFHFIIYVLFSFTLDEGIGRTDSDSSTTSSYTPSTVTTTTGSNQAWTLNRHSSLGDFVGPRLSSSSSNGRNCQKCKARSVGDITALTGSPLIRRLHRQTFQAEV